MDNDIKKSKVDTAWMNFIREEDVIVSAPVTSDFRNRVRLPLTGEYYIPPEGEWDSDKDLIFLNWAGTRYFGRDMFVQTKNGFRIRIFTEDKGSIVRVTYSGDGKYCLGEVITHGKNFEEVVSEVKSKNLQPANECWILV